MKCKKKFLLSLTIFSIFSILPMNSLFAGWSLQLQTESIDLFKNGFALVAEPGVKYSGKAGDHSFKVGLEWEIPILQSANIGKLELEALFKLKASDMFSLGIQNELYFNLNDLEKPFADEITLEPFFKVTENISVGAEIEMDIVSKNVWGFDLEIEPTFKWTFFKGDAGKLSLEVEAPALQIIKGGTVPAAVVESADAWLTYAVNFNDNFGIKITAGSGYNFAKNGAQYKLEPALTVKF